MHRAPGNGLKCALKSTCDGAVATFIHVLLGIGVLPSVSRSIDVPAVLHAGTSNDSALESTSPPEPHPPRS
jgi:hypothetical protein